MLVTLIKFGRRRTFMPRTSRARSVVLLALLALLAGIAGAAPVAAHPALDTIALSSPYGRVTIARDAVGVPLVRARGEDGAQFGLGYAHAQDRLWQMEWQRRLAAGRTAEIVGARGLPADTLFRTVGLRRAAEAAWAALAPDERRPIAAYAAGVNAFLATKPALPPEFAIHETQPEPWSPVDVLAFNKLFIWGNGSTWDKELLRARLAALVGPARAAQLTPAYSAGGPTIIPGEAAEPRASVHSADDALPIAPELEATLDALLALHGEVATRTGVGADGRGSNSWVLAGSRTSTGAPVLANDPHLSAQSPSFWYMAQLAFDGRRVTGATIPGAPGVLVGQNGAISWGVTTINVDGQDLYVEQLNAQNEALFQGVWEPLTVVPETIQVRDAPAVALNVRVSRHGPLLSDVVAPGGPALAVRWTGHDPADDGILSALAVNRAHDWASFRAAFRDHRPANQNYVYADRAGNIGTIAAGIIPIRAQGDGSLPAPGWTGTHEWTGYVPAAELPQRLNPPEGFIVAANNRVVGDSYPYLIGTSFAAPYRAARAVELLAARPRHSADDMAAIQGDVLAVHARTLMPTLLQVEPSDERGRQALDLLKTWDLRAEGDSAAAAVFEAWYVRIAQRLFADELGALWPAYGRNLNFVGMATEAALLERQPWCDDVATPATESCDELLALALDDGLRDMASAQGSDEIAAWRWDRVHRAQFPHLSLADDPAHGPRFNRSVPNDGDRFTVNVASSFRRWEEYDQFHAAMYRQIVDMRRPGGSRWIVAPGQGGNPDAPHYDDQLARWRQLGYLPMPAAPPAR
jgi:penicillin G amidase